MNHKSKIIFACLIFSFLIYFVNANEECADAKYVFNFNPQIEIVCRPVLGYNTSESRIVNIEQIGKYKVFGEVRRGNPKQCQNHEEFFIEVNGVAGNIVYDDLEPCAETTRFDELGIFDFSSGSNTITMNHGYLCQGTNLYNSVELFKICLYPIKEEKNETKIISSERASFLIYCNNYEKWKDKECYEDTNYFLNFLKKGDYETFGFEEFEIQEEKVEKEKSLDSNSLSGYYIFLFGMLILFLILILILVALITLRKP